MQTLISQRSDRLALVSGSSIIYYFLLLYLYDGRIHLSLSKLIQSAEGLNALKPAASVR